MDDLIVFKELKEQNKKLSQYTTNDALKSLKRYEALSQINNKKRSPVLKKLQSNFLTLQTIMAQLVIDATKQEVQRYQIDFTNVLRKTAKLNLEFTDETLKKTIAEKVNVLLHQLHRSDGLFYYALEVAEIQDDINFILKSYKLKQQELNQEIIELINFVTNKTKSDIAKANDITNNNINIVYILMLCLFVLSISIILFYINPIIIKRLSELAENTKQIAFGNYDVKINISGNDEISEMSQALNGFKQALINKTEIEQKIKESEIYLRNIIENAADVSLPSMMKVLLKVLILPVRYVWL